MVAPILIAAPVTLVPAFAALWLLLRHYNEFFQDARFFGSLVLGFFLGLVAAFFELALLPAFQDPGYLAANGAVNAFLFFVPGFAFMETGLKTAALGYKIYKGRADSPFYGAALGMGFGAMITVQFIARNLQFSETIGIPYQFLPFVTMAALFLGILFTHCAAAVLVAKGSADGELWKGWALGALVQMPAFGLLWLFWPSIGVGNAVVVLPGVAALLYGAGMLWLVERKILAGIVPQEIKDKLRRARRREARRARQESGP